MDGIILDKFDIASSGSTFKSSITTGVCVSEESIGTNSISLCMTLNIPISLSPQHHYCDLLSKCYEYCIPLFCSSKILGYIAIITANYPVNPELIAITNLINYKICNEYPKLEKQSTNERNVSDRLNDKQLEILKHMAEGLTDYAISREMKLSISTVKYHKQNIKKKYNATTSTQAFVKAIKSNNLSIDDIP